MDAQTTKKPHRMITREGYKSILAYHGFGHSQNGCFDILNDYLERVGAQMQGEALLIADAEKKTGLKGKHAQKAIDNTPQIPRGHYGCAN